MDWREKMQRSIDEAKFRSGVTEPERIFMTDDVSTIPFERSEWTKLRDHQCIMDHFDLVMEIKRTGLFVAGDLIPKSINGYSVKCYEVGFSHTFFSCYNGRIGMYDYLKRNLNLY